MKEDWLEAEDLLTLLAEHTGPAVRIRDGGILVAVAARASARLVEVPIYPTPVGQAAALLHGIVAWRPLSLWNAGLAWGAAATHLRGRDVALRMPAWERMQLTDDLIAGRADSIDEITARLAPYVVPITAN